MKRAPLFASEAALCSAFQAFAAPWAEVYPESCGHDVVLRVTHGERGGLHPFAIGDVVAVEAKLRPTLGVLRQAIPFDRLRYGRKHGADFYAVLLPSSRNGEDFDAVADALGVLRVGIDYSQRWGWRHAGSIDQMRCFPVTQSAPLLAVEMAGGQPAPRAVTPWKVAAVRLCLNGTGHRFKRADLADVLNVRTFVDRGWAAVAARDGRHAVYELLDATDRPDRCYPEIAAALGGAP